MSRSIKKAPFLSARFIFQSFLTPRSKIKHFLKSRASTVAPELIGETFQIYNGRSLFKLKISDVMVGKKFGEFSNTRKVLLSKKSRNAR